METVQRIFQNKFFLIGGILLLFLILGAGSIAGAQVLFSDKILPRISAGPLSLSGQTKEKAIEDLENFLQQEEGKLVLSLEGKETRPQFADLGLVFNKKQIINDAFVLGHEGNWLKRTKDFLFSLVNPPQIKIYYHLDRTKLNQYLEENFDEFFSPPRNATWQIEAGNKFKFIPAAPGTILSVARLEEDLLDQLQQGRLGVVILAKENKNPDILDAEAQNAKIKAEKLLQQKLTLIFEEQKWRIPSSQIASWMEFIAVAQKSADGQENIVLDAQINANKAGEYLGEIAPQVEKKGDGVNLEMKDGKLIVHPGTTPSYELDILFNSEKIAKAIEEGKQEVTLTLKEVAPLSAAKLKELKIKELIASGESNFAGSPKNRIHNIRIGAARFNGALIAPGEEFSFNNQLGPVDGRHGFLPELVILQDKTVPEFGGGLCQVSTTAFRAAMYAGLPITERKNHAYPVRYYGKPGFDATIILRIQI